MEYHVSVLVVNIFYLEIDDGIKSLKNRGIKCLFFFYKKPELYLNEIERIKLYLGNKVY